jgi:hypothetical protein
MLPLRYQLWIDRSFFPFRARHEMGKFTHFRPGTNWVNQKDFVLSQATNGLFQTANVRYQTSAGKNRTLLCFFCPPTDVRHPTADLRYPISSNHPQTSLPLKCSVGLGALTKAEWLTHITFACHAGTMVHATKGWSHHEVSQVNVEEMEETWQGARELGVDLPEVICASRKTCGCLVQTRKG